jgi:hypothetical protein
MEEMKMPAAANVGEETQPAKGPVAQLRFLQPRDVGMIDDALAGLGEFGEVHLVVQKGRLRYIVTQRSVDTLKWSPPGTEGDRGRGGRSFEVNE